MYCMKQSKNTTMTVRIEPEVERKLEALARDMHRSKAYLASEAITDFVGRNAWQVEEIRQALEEHEAGTPGVPHEDVRRWVESWGTENELERPTPRV